MRAHLIKRFLFFMLGIVLFYAPFALLTRLLLHLLDSPLRADVHRICLRMPVEWLLQPWMYPTMIRQPLYLVAALLLPATAFFLGPLFCGWVCPAGQLPEWTGRIVPDRLKLDLAGRINPSPIRYGVLAGTLLAPFAGAHLCCAFCNFGMMQNLVSAAAGEFTGLLHWASFSIITFALWFFILGIFMKGGRGWCNFICPAGALMAIFHAVGARAGLPAVRIDPKQCDQCGRCASDCPAWAITRHSPPALNLHACNACLDCVHVCASGAIHYGKRGPATRFKAPLPALPGPER
ncbi:MAG TPA: 4Fe-4S binding protein [bacterium]|nr:4Fe-4S binding protein [bacterium]